MINAVNTIYNQANWYSLQKNCPIMPVASQSYIPSEVYTAQNNIENLKSGRRNLYEEYRENPEFVKLQKSEYFLNDKLGTENLINLVKDLEIAKNSSVISSYANNVFDGGLEKRKANIDITKCLYNINKVIFDERISKTAKDYTMMNANNLRFHILALDSLDRILAGNNIQKIEETIFDPLVVVYY